MIRDYDNITPEQEAAETVVFGQWFDWFFVQQGIPQDTAFVLDNEQVRTLSDYKAMLIHRFPLQESALTYLPGVAVAKGKSGLLQFVQGIMTDFYRIGYLP